MSKIRIHELIKELRKSSREVTDRLRKLGIPFKSTLSTLTVEEANIVRESFGLKPVKVDKPEAEAAAKKPAVKKAGAKAAAKKVEKKAAAKPPTRKAAVKQAAKKVTRKPAAKKASAAKKKPSPRTKKEQLETPVLAGTPAPPEPGAKGAVTAVIDEEKILGEKESGVPAPETRQELPLPEVEEPGDHTAEVIPLKAEPSVEREGELSKQVRERTEAALEEEVPKRAPSAGREPKEATRTERELAPKPKLRVAAAKPGPGETVREKRKVIKFKPPRQKEAVRQGRSSQSTVAPKLIRVPSGITVKEFAQKIGVSPSELIKKLVSLGEMLSVNQPISDEALMLLSEEFEIGIKIKASKTDVFEKLEEIEDRLEDLEPRPPIVTVMGHVDHGKTLLLDTIRKTDVVSREFGGITQHIGAYQVTYDGRRITFIDTPGHESFTAMRARGASVTDIAVLVVAADDGVMPQTLEALDHAREAEVPVLVAVNKIDKPDANPQRVRQQLSEKGLVPEEWGGDTIYVDVSAKEGTNIEHLLEMILLMADILELKANPRAEASGVIIEARLDRAKGPVASVLVKRGTAKVGDVVVSGSVWGKVRAMFNDRGIPVERAGPSTPVEVLGLSGLPMAGDDFRVVQDEKTAKQIADRRKMQMRMAEQKRLPRVSFENLLERLNEEEIKELKIIVKADTQGSLEAISDSLKKIQSDEVRLRVIHSGIGRISETDVMLASASDAVIIGFNVRPDGKAARAAEAEAVDLRTYQVIYDLLDDVEKALKGMLAPEYVEEIEGRAEIRRTFRVPGIGTVAGSYVLEGEINRGSNVRLLRDGVVVYTGKIASLKRFKDDVKTVSANYECGIALDGFQDVKEGDVLETFILREVPR